MDTKEKESELSENYGKSASKTI